MKMFMRKSKLAPLTAVLTTAMLLGATAVAQDKPAEGGHKSGMSSVEQKYQGAPSPLASEPMHQTSN